MGRLYKCNHPKCKGHDTFSAICPQPVFQGYSALDSFIEEGLETQPMKALPIEVLEPITPAPEPEPERVAVTVSDVSPRPNKDYMTFWRE